MSDGTSEVAIGIDVGGTKCLGVVVDANWRVRRSARRPTRRRFEDLAAVLDEIVAELDPRSTTSPSSPTSPTSPGSTTPGDSAAHTAGDAPPTADRRPSIPVGIGLPGLIDREGRMYAAPHLDDPSDGPLEAQALLSERFGRQVAIDNDAACHAIAEWRLGAAQGIDHFLMITLGSGIGGGVVMDGQLQRGKHGFAGEFGHMMVDPDGPACPCGRRGCWERYASGQGLRALARAAFDSGRLTSLRGRRDLTSSDVTGEMVHEAARDGDAGAMAVLHEFADWIAVGLSSLTNAYDPEAFVLGGGLAGTEDVLGEPIRQRLATRLYSSIRRPMPEVRFAALGPDAGAIGAALLVAPSP